MDPLFASPVLRVDQPRRAPASLSSYRLYDGRGTLLAVASEKDIPLYRRAARTAIGGSDGDRTVHLENAQGTPLLVLKKTRSQDHRVRGTWVSTPDGAPIGSVQMGKYPWEHTLMDGAGNVVGRLAGNRPARRFQVLDVYGDHVAQVDKNLKGAATEVLTTADKYTVEIFHAPPDPLRVLVVAAPIAIDLLLYEQKDWPVG